MRYILKEFNRQDLLIQQEKAMKEIQQKEKEIGVLQKKLRTLMETTQVLRSEE